MLYELIAVVRPGRSVNEVKEIARTAGNQVLSSGGVVRGITNWGTFLLPKPVNTQAGKFHHGHYFIMRFDSDAKTQHSIRKTMGLDPRMVRFSVVKLAWSLEKLRQYDGQAAWPTIGSSAVE